VNISLDTLRPDRFERMTRRRGLGLVLDSIEEAVQLGFDPVKVRTPGTASSMSFVLGRRQALAWL
jgi:molybdenum cofactor biosynthesis enzyme MoaA